MARRDNNKEEKKDFCFYCQHKEFIVSWQTVDGRPKFVCTRCRTNWTSGSDGGDYIKSKFAKVIKDGKAVKLCLLTGEEEKELKYLSWQSYLESVR